MSEPNFTEDIVKKHLAEIERLQRLLDAAMSITTMKTLEYIASKNGGQYPKPAPTKHV